MFQHGAGRNVKWSRISSWHVFTNELAHVSDKATNWNGELPVSLESKEDMGDDRKFFLNSSWWGMLSTILMRSYRAHRKLRAAELLKSAGLLPRQPREACQSLNQWVWLQENVCDSGKHCLGVAPICRHLMPKSYCKQRKIAALFEIWSLSSRRSWRLEFGFSCSKETSGI